MTVQEKLTCKDKVKDSLQDLLDDWLLASLYCGETEEQLKEQGHDIEAVEDYLQYESLFDYVNMTALSWDFEKGNTFSMKLNKSESAYYKAGYYRLNLSYGGPSTEFRVYTDKDLNIDRIEYWYLDWYDGASVVVDSSSYIVVDLIMQFLEIEKL
jgi:hypothetical protein